MVTPERFVNAINSYVSDELAPSVPGLMKWGISIGAGAYIGKMLDEGILRKIGYQSEDGTIDDDRMRNDLINVARSGPVVQHVPFAGDFKFTESDIESIFRRMK